MTKHHSITEAEPILSIRNLKKYYPVRKGLFGFSDQVIKAVDGVTIHIQRGETLGLVGESGSGKTTVGRCVLRAIDPTGGEIIFRPDNGQHIDLASASMNEVRKFRPYMHMIFQDPYSSLSPRMTVRDIIAEPLISNRWENGNREAVNDRVRQVAELCGLSVEHLRRYPHAFSGGQRQRIGIARSLALNPRLLICDEPVSALDVSIQAQIINLLIDLQEQLNLTYLFVAHDLSVVEHISDRVAVIYLGRLVELARADELFFAPLHPYTEALMSAIPLADPAKKMKPLVLPGEIPDIVKSITGCPFQPRCRFALEICREEMPVWAEAAPGHFVACHLADRLHLTGVERQYSGIKS
jgi:peptide/nickel transport system ATP-binding protein